MAEEVQQDGQKTLVAFIVGLLIGGMLVWAFSGPEANAPEATTDSDTEETAETEESTEETAANTNDTDESDSSTPEETSTAQLSVGDGNIVVSDQAAGMSVDLDGTTYPVSEGWVGVRDYTDGNLGYIKGVVRFSESQSLVPDEIVLQQPTVAGREYAVVVFEEDGDYDFSTAGDVQIPEIFDTFTAQ